MLLFNFFLIFTHHVKSIISKHLMLLFNGRNQTRTRSYMGISKHLMLLFNNGEKSDTW